MERKAITPGCLVLITGSSCGTSPNVGKMATVLFKIDENSFMAGRTFHKRTYGLWCIEGPGIMCKVTNNMTGETWQAGDFCTSHPEHLLRIDPEADPLDTETDQPLQIPQLQKDNIHA